MPSFIATVPFTRMKRPLTRPLSSFVERVRLQELFLQDDEKCKQGLSSGHFLFLRKGDLLMNKKHRALHWTDYAAASRLCPNLEDHFVFLGLDKLSSQPLFACPIQQEEKDLLDSVDHDDSLRFVNLRLAMFTTADDEDGPRPGMALATRAWSLLRWHRKSGFCSNCGQRSRRNFSGSHRSCSSCGEVAYPHTSPVGIALPTAPDASKVLLIRQPVYPPGMYSCVAGFLDVGESLEACVRREVAEEVGLEVEQVSVKGSQHWPFPSGSLMVGCEAVLADSNDQPSVDGKEIEEARWFSPDQLLKAYENSRLNPRLRFMDDNDPENVFVPPRQAIAHHLIKGWLKDNGHLPPSH